MIEQNIITVITVIICYSNIELKNNLSLNRNGRFLTFFIMIIVYFIIIY